MRRIAFCFLAILFFLFNSNEVSATHIMGGEITWECNGNGEYNFTISVYRDCSPGSFTSGVRMPLYIHNYPARNNVTRLAQLGPLPPFSNVKQYTNFQTIDISPDCPGVSCANQSSLAVEQSIAEVNGVKPKYFPTLRLWQIHVSIIRQLLGKRLPVCFVPGDHLHTIITLPMWNWTPWSMNGVNHF